MEKTKNELPYYLRIDKQKDGTPVIVHKAFRFSVLPLSLFVLFGYGVVLYFMLSVEVLWGFNWHTLGIVTMSLVNSLLVLDFLWGLFGETKIILEPDYLLKKTLHKKLYIPEKDMASSYTNGPLELRLKLHNGESIILLGGVRGIESAGYLSHFINDYYGLDEKAKIDS